MFISFDIGGTNIRGRISSVDAGRVLTHAALDTTYEELASGRYGCSNPVELIGPLIRQLETNLNLDGSQIRHATLAVAGRVRSDRKYARITATHVEIDARLARQILNEVSPNASVDLINDFEAAAYGAALTTSSQRHQLRGVTLSPAQEAERKRVLICGPGTGLGIACLIFDAVKPGHPYVVTSEAGHVSFAPETKKERDFLEDEPLKRLTYENVISGPGLVRTYQYLAKVHKTQSLQLDATPEDVCRLAKQANPLAVDAVELFSHALGAFCGNQALTFNIDRGIYLWGGVLAGLPDALLMRHFSPAIGNRLMHAETIAALPVYRVTNPDMAHHGCILFSQLQENL